MAGSDNGNGTVEYPLNITNEMRVFIVCAIDITLCDA